MSDNPQDSQAPFFRLGFGVIAVSGPDAVKFMQAQCMSDVATLAAEHWQWSGWLTPKGRVIALFALVKLDEQTLWLVLPDADPAALTAQLRRFIFRSKVVIDVRDDLAVAGAFAPPPHARGARLSQVEGRVELDLGADGGARTLCIGSMPAEENPPAPGQWTRFDLTHGLPRLARSQAEQWTPHMLSLERLRAFSVKKGCYPGQEIVARTHFLGQAKRGLALLEADAPLATGGEIGDGDRMLGTIVSAVDGAKGNLALAVLPLERGDVALYAGTTPLRERPLLGGLAR